MVETRYVISADFIEYTNNDCWDFVRHDIYEVKDKKQALELADELEQKGFIEVNRICVLLYCGNTFWITIKPNCI